MITLNQDAPAAKPAGRSDSSHFYGWNEKAGWYPLYTPEKNYTLREARKDQAAGVVAVPSVTTYFKCLNKQQLLDWKMEQVANACYDDQEARSWERDEYVQAMVARADNASRPAADLGTAIHAAIELAIADKDYEAGMDQYVQPVMKARAELGIKSLGVETCCGSLGLGYGGKCDEYAEGFTIVDLKSRKSKPAKQPKVASYSTDRLQTASYGYALFGNDFFTKGRGIILGISTTVPGLVTAHEFTGAELADAFDAFIGLTKVWRFENSFDPRFLIPTGNHNIPQDAR